MSTPEPASQSPLAAFLAWHAAEPDGVAIESYGEHDGTARTLTVGDVYARAVRIAQALLAVPGAQQDDVVGIQVELESELYVAFIACWMAGRSVLPRWRRIHPSH
jgi:acyl-CoA synthetase (AMP-forming)/AMP-acid ligase II